MSTSRLMSNDSKPKGYQCVILLQVTNESADALPKEFKIRE